MVVDPGRDGKVPPRCNPIVQECNDRMGVEVGAFRGERESRREHVELMPRRARRDDLDFRRRFCPEMEPDLEIDRLAVQLLINGVFLATPHE